MRQRVAGFTQAIGSSPSSTPTPMLCRPRKRRRVSSTSQSTTHVSETESIDSEPSGLHSGHGSSYHGTRSSESITEIDTPSGVASGFTDDGKLFLALLYQANDISGHLEGVSVELA